MSAVNAELLNLYWNIGKYMSKKIIANANSTDKYLRDFSSE